VWIYTSKNTVHVNRILKSYYSFQGNIDIRKLFSFVGYLTTPSVAGLYKYSVEWIDDRRVPRVEAESNTFTVALGSRRRRKGNPVPGGITRPPCTWGI
jgi:hypothetical protein